MSTTPHLLLISSFLILSSSETPRIRSSF
jgi:hypothetical protein